MKRLDNILEFKHFDWLTFTLPVVMTVLGIMTIYSATRPLFDTPHPPYYIRQTVWLLLGIMAMFLTASFDYKRLIRYAYPIYAVGLILLGITIVLGHTGMGAQRWLRIGPISFQPSEFFKVALIIVVARFLSASKSPLNISGILVSIGLFGILPFILLYKQPDLGTGLLMLIIVTIMMLCKGIPRRIVVIATVLLIVSLPVTGNLFWKGLKDYQKNRLVAFIDPKVDPRGIGYQIEQSKVTIGSGEFFGKGYLKGTQGPLRFLPEKHTDFIFSVFAEEWGFLGSFLLLSLYAVLIIRGFETAYYSKDDFGTLLSIGISIMFLLYVTINVGMTMGLMPVVGIPLPFFSYGGTALLTNFICIGLLINVRRHRFSLFY